MAEFRAFLEYTRWLDEQRQGQPFAPGVPWPSYADALISAGQSLRITQGMYLVVEKDVGGAPLHMGVRINEIVGEKLAQVTVFSPSDCLEIRPGDVLRRQVVPAFDGSGGTPHSVMMASVEGSRPDHE